MTLSSIPRRHSARPRLPPRCGHPRSEFAHPKACPQLGALGAGGVGVAAVAGGAAAYVIRRPRVGLILAIATEDRAAARAQPSGEVVQYPSADRCFSLQVAAPFLMQAAPGIAVPGPGLPGDSRAGNLRCPRISRSDLTREPDERNGADTRSAGGYFGRVRLLADSQPRL